MNIRAQLLLGLAMLAAISFVGCIFELASGEPDLGTTTTWAILLVSAPVGVVAFIKAVQLARANLTK
ncbi:MAG: hypothetical protein ACK4QL_06325 [Pseudanabaenaceae cyanobacterium]